jgi:predicted MFS family arabinose efflux permease
VFGFVFLSHQVGAFAGAFLGGVVYERSGTYDPMWVLCIVLSVMAAAVHLPIREARAPRWVARTA